MNGLGKRIKEIRKGFHLTQRELADRAGVGLRFVRELEQGKETVRLDKVNKILQFFNYRLELVKNEPKI